MDAPLAEDASLGLVEVILAYIHNNNCFGKDEPDFPSIELDELDWLDYNSCNNLGFHSNRRMDSLSFQGCCRSCRQYCRCLISAGWNHNCCSCLLEADCRHNYCRHNYYYSMILVELTAQDVGCTARFGRHRNLYKNGELYILICIGSSMVSNAI